MKKVIYTTVFGNYDRIKTPRFINEDYDYILFTDSDTFDSERLDINDIEWKISVYNNGGNPKMKAKDIKVNPHKYLKGYDLSVYFDGSFQQINDINLLVKETDDFKMCKHPRRICAYEEASVCSRMRLDSTSVIKNQIDRYKSEGFPENFGLAMGGIIIRKHNKKSKAISELWWEEIKKGSNRDQLSFNYCLWKLNETIDYSDFENDALKVLSYSHHLTI